MATIQIKRGTAADWLAANPVLALGELGLETDTNKLKAGNGTSSWYELQYIAGSGGGGGGAVTSVNSKTGDVVLVKADLGLGNVDNTTDAAKPISAATQIALDAKADDVDLTALDAKVDTKAAQTDLDALAGRVGTNEGDISTKIGAVVEDTTPQLGGDLDVQNFIISSSVDDVQFASDVVPLQDGQTDLGSATNKWKDVYVEDGIAFTDKRTNDESILSIRDGQLIVTDSTQEVTTAVDLGGTTPDPGHIRNVELDGTGRYSAGPTTLFNTNGLVTREFINSPGQFFVINDIDGGVFTGGNRQGFGLVRETMVDGTDLSGRTEGLLTGGNSGGWSLGGVWYYTGGYPYIWTSYSIAAQTPQGAGEGYLGTFGNQLYQKLWWEACTIAGVGKKIRVGIADGANSDQTGLNLSNRLVQQLWVSNEILSNPTAASLLPQAAIDNGEGWYNCYATSGDYENMGQFPATATAGATYVGENAKNLAGVDKGYRFRWSTFGSTTLNQLPYVQGVPSINDQIAAATGLSYYLVYEPSAADKAAANVTLATGTTSAENPFYVSKEVVLLQFQQPYTEFEADAANIFDVSHTDIGAVQSSPVFQTYDISDATNIIESGLSVQGIESIRATVSEIVLQAVIGYYMIRELDASERATVRTTFAPIIQAASTGQLQEVYDLVSAVTADPLFPQELLDAILDRTAFYLKNYPVF